MGVDGIGGGSGGSRTGVSGAPDASARIPGARPSESAAVERGLPAQVLDARAPAESAAPPGSAALQQLSRGDIDVEQYLDTRAADAVRHLEGRLPESQIAFIRKALREEMSADPVLVELVRRTTGSLPALETE